jgi:hypothetical protein
VFVVGVRIPTVLPPVEPRAPGAGEEACVVCGRPIRIAGHPFFVWVHAGGGVAVTEQEGRGLAAAGHGTASRGYRPVGVDCFREHPELRPYVRARKA